MKQEIIDRIDELNARGDKELEAAIDNAKSLEEIVSILNEKGVDVTVADLTGINASGELTEDALEEVAGGAFNWGRFKRGYNDGYGGSKKDKNGDLWYCIGYGIGAFLR